MKKSNVIYLDNCSTTPIDPTVAQVILECSLNAIGNPSSIQNSYGIEANIIVENSRAKIAEFFGVNPKNIVFTSGATEANNIILKGLFYEHKEKKNKIVISAIEHSSVYETAMSLKKSGADIIVIKTNDKGEIDLDELYERIDNMTLLVSIIFANNEIGTVQDIEAISKICMEKGVLFHSDMAQAVGKIDINLKKIGVHYATLSSHKNYGPKGIGALYISDEAKKIKLQPLIEGGGQEFGLRSGTLSVPLIAGFAKSLEISKSIMKEEVKRIRYLRDKLQYEILSRCPEAKLNGIQENRLPGIINFHFPSIPVNSIINELRNKVAFSTASACGEIAGKASRILLAIGLNEYVARNSIRLCVGRFNDEDEMLLAAEYFEEAYKKLKIF